MRLTQLLLPTIKEDPAGAEAISHKLMVRAGLVRQLAAGIYVYLPAGWRVMRKIERIIREEMDAIGCQEMLMPVLQPAEIWQEWARWDEIQDEMFRLKDRKRADMALAMTHEEVVTWLAAREIQSYKQLPQLWYHIQTKERDEARPQERHPAHARVHHEGLVQPRPSITEAPRGVATRSTSAPTTGSTVDAASTA